MSAKLTRREFHRLTAAAVGGLMLGCGQGGQADGDADKAPAGGDAATTASQAPQTAPAQTAPAAGDTAQTAEKHVCCGLNSCKGAGKDGGNACAGQGTCATANKHGCHALNECKGQGGCGDHPGSNECKGQGECGVPLSAKAWKKARADFEAKMAAAGTAPGAAPEACIPGA